jgi:hypothetical protein
MNARASYSYVSTTTLAVAADPGVDLALECRCTSRWVAVGVRRNGNQAMIGTEKWLGGRYEGGGL